MTCSTWYCSERDTSFWSMIGGKRLISGPTAKMVILNGDLLPLYSLQVRIFLYGQKAEQETFHLREKSGSESIWNISSERVGDTSVWSTDWVCPSYRNIDFIRGGIIAARGRRPRNFFTSKPSVDLEIGYSSL